MRILFIGGNGNISWHCTMQALAQNHEVWVLNRGESTQNRRPLPAHVKTLHADIQDPQSASKALQGLTFDVVADFICFTH